MRKVIRHPERGRESAAWDGQKRWTVSREETGGLRLGITFNLIGHFQNEGYKMLDLISYIFARIIPSTKQPGLRL